MLERITIGCAAALWAAFVPGAAHTCLDHHWEAPSQWLRRRLANAPGRLTAGAPVGAGRASG
jgi:hypothetical protein